MSKLFKIVILGDSLAVGKTCIVRRFVDGVFGPTIATIGVELGMRTIGLNGKTIKLLVCDTGGSERFNSIIGSHIYNKCSGVLVVYDVLGHRGLEPVKQQFLPLIEKHYKPDVVKMLIANKCDVAMGERAISTKEGRQFAIDHGMRFMEVSAKSGMNVERAFVTIAREMLIVECKLPVIPEQREFLTCCEVGDFDSIAWHMLPNVCDPRTVATPIDRSTPMHYSSLNGNLSAMKLLVEKYKCDVSCKDYLGETPLHWAVENGNIDIVKYMVSGNYASPSNKNVSGQNALHIACKYGHIEIIKYLLRTITEGCIQQKDVFQKTALHWACESGCEEAIKLMVAHLDPNEDLNGHNCLHIVYNSNTHACPRWKEIVEYLISLPQCDVGKKDKNGRTCLHWASEEGQLDLVKYLISERHCNPNDKNKDGLSCLHIACKAGCLHAMEYLINERLCNPSDRTDHGHDCLHIACEYYRIKIIDYLVSEVHLDPTRKDANGQSCLQLAYCSELHRNFAFDLRDKTKETVRYLISLPQCTVDEKDTSGGTCLHWACQEGLIDIVKYLMSERKCDPNVKNGLGQNCRQVALREGDRCSHKKEKYAKIIEYLSETKDISGRDIQRDWLHWACSRGYANLVKYFISDLHYNPNDKNHDGQNCFHVACSRGRTAIVEYLMSETQCDIQEKDKFQRSGLHLACVAGCVDTVKLLTRSLKFNVNERDEEGQHCLHLAYTIIYSWGFLVETVKYLITLPQCVVDEQNKEGKTCLHWACQKGHLNIAKYLISERHCDPNDENHDNQNCLQIAFEHDQLTVVEYLLHNTECDYQGSDKYGRTCLHWACEKGHLNLVMKLITEKNSNPSIKSRDGLNCLHIACRYGKVNIVTYLLKETQVDVHEKDTYGRTCLHWACEKGNIDIVRILPIHEFDLSQRDFSGKTPTQLAQKKEVLVELIWCGADPTDELMNLLQPMSEPSISMFVVGNPSAGKTTLVKALTSESSGITAFFNRYLFRNVSVEAQTAGIIPTEFESDIYGRVTFFDLAGQKQYYASHAAVLQKSISSAPPIILLVVKLNENEEGIKRNLLYWFHFLENQCKEDYSEASTRPHLFIIGSHADTPQTLDERTRSRLLQQLEIKPLRLVEFVELDCRKAQSAGISHLRQSLKTSCDVLRKDAKVEFKCHCLLVFLLDRFRERGAISLREFITAITELPQAETAQPHDFIPYSPTTISGFCSELNARGHILFLKNETNIENSWIILNNEVLLQQVLGTVFAPKEFKEHRELASSTGVVPFSKLARHFADHDGGMLAQFLCHLEFCHEIRDPEVLEIIYKDYQAHSSTGSDEQYFFFPSLVSVATPDQLQVWGDDSRYSYRCGWMLQCSDPEQFLTPRFLQVLLLRLAFFFALAPSDPTVHEAIPVLKRKCSVWKNGIHWLDDDGVSTLFEVDEQSQSLTVIMRCLEGSEMECVCLRSNIIHKVLAALHEFCPRVPSLESFIHPCDVQYPLKPREQLTLFDVTAIATSVLKAKRAVVTDSQNTATITELLYFEPYANFGQTLLLELFNKGNPDYDQEQVTDDFLYVIANKIEEKYGCFKKMLNLPPASVQFWVSQGPPGPAHAMAHLLLCWRERSEGTRECLRSKMNEFSVFAGRNPLVRSLT